MSTQPDNVIALNKVQRFMSGIMDRLRLGFLAGLTFGGKRDLYKVFGYDSNPTCMDFLAKYSRQDIAGRVIDAPPAATWSNPPELVLGGKRNTTKWTSLAQPLKFWSVLERADRLARMGRFSTILLGFNDSKSIDQPLTKGKADELVYMRAIGERQLDITAFETNTKDPRFGKPTQYEVTFDDPRTKNMGFPQGKTKPLTGGMKAVKVHWSRMIHIVENPLEDDIFCTPIMQKVYNLLDDILKTAGGTAETYWLIANRGLQLDVDKEMEMDKNDAAELADEVEKYQHQLTRVLRTRGVKVNQLGSESPDPKNTFEVLMALLSGATGIPQRILIGSEAGQLASQQDRANWAERIGERRKLYAEPFILCPLVERLMFAGVLNEEDYSFEWPEAFILSPLERAQTMAQKARAVANFAGQTGSTSHMQITSREEARKMIELEGDLAEGDKQQTDGDLAREQLDLSKKTQQDAHDVAMTAAKNPKPVVAPPGAGGGGTKKAPPQAA